MHLFSKTEPDSPIKKDWSHDFLMAEYQRLHEMFIKNEETGETRVNYFTGIVTAAIGAIGFVIAKNGTILDQIATIAVVAFALVALLVLGTITLLRMIKRNQVTDELKHSLDEIRLYYQTHFYPDGFMDDYQPFKTTTVKTLSLRKLGSLVHIVAALNALIAGAGVVILLYQSGPPFMIMGGITLFGVLFSLQYYYSKHAETTFSAALARGGFTHAGGVVFRIQDGIPRYLLITATDNIKRWVLPKGHIEPGETPHHAALREVKEETHINGRILDQLGTLRYLKDKERVNALFYLIEYTAEATLPGKPDRHPEWHTYEDALEKLTFNDSKALLTKAHMLVTPPGTIT